MASISSDSNGYKRLLVVLPNEQRISIRLGKVSLRHAETIRDHVAELVGSQLSGRTPKDTTSKWIAELDGRLRRKLAKQGLVKARESWSLRQLIEAWVERRSKSLKPGTIVRLEQGKRSLLKHFGENRVLSDINEGEVEDYRAALLAEGLAEATVRKRCSDARVWYRYATRHGYVQSNPFEVVPTAAVATGHLTYISEADALRVLNEIRNPDLRLIFVLSRWGGLRIISEPKALTWDCINWEDSKIIVKSPKTERHAGHEQRTIPMFPELVRPLHDALDRAADGEVNVLPLLHRVSSASLRKPMFAAIKRAGLKAWPRLWHNLRSSRQTDLENRFPNHVVCRWLGNSTMTARRHYLQVLESDFTKATAPTVSEKAAHKAAQMPADAGRNDPQLVGAGVSETPDFSGDFDDVRKPAGRSSDPDGI